jgi:5'-nucleotidase
MSNMEKKGTILLTNDDGFYAEGIRLVYNELIKNYKVIVSAPETEKSGVGHAFTFNKPLHFKKSDESDSMNGYIVNGTPSDCVKFAISYILPQRPDFVVSGMNFGENSGLSAFYSGTVAAAREGAFWNIPSFAFSICKETVEYAKEYASMVPPILKKLIAANQKINSNRTYYNVNFPPCKPSAVKSTKITWQSTAFFDDRYEKIEVATHESGTGYMIYGEKKDIEHSNAYDSRALMNNIIAITPLTFDSTAHNAIPLLRDIEDEDFTRGDF